jgi:CubicO group peptidase (beta-lactamase class C family)
MEDIVDRIASETGFSGVVRVDRGEGVELLKAYGLANRTCHTPNTEETQFGIASGTKGLTALTVVSLIQEGRIQFQTHARSVLGKDLPLVNDDVTIEHLLAHRSGVGDYLDEEKDVPSTAYAMEVPVHELARTEDYLKVLDGRETKFPPGDRFSYSNSGYVALALIAERITSVPFEDLVRQRVCKPAGMPDSEFLRSDELPGRAAIGYLSADGLRTNVLHLPVLGSGDGGIYSTAADVQSFWSGFFGGRIVSPEWVEKMTRPHSDVPSNSMRYGLGFWLGQRGNAVMLEGADAGVSFNTVHDPKRRLTHTVLSNTSDGAWPIARYLNETLTP